MNLQQIQLVACRQQKYVGNVCERTFYPSIGKPFGPILFHQPHSGLFY